jgi:peptide/nickel transport system permease protein
VASLTVAAALGAAALFGEVLAPYDPTATVSPPWTPPGPGLALGADGLGRDVVSRVLAGGRELTLVAAVAALTATAVGVAGGLWAGWRGRGGRALLGGADLLLALPMLLIAMVLAVALPGPVAVVAGTVCGGAPLTLRVIADATRQVRHTGYVEAAVARGERSGIVLVREVLPALAGVVGADVGLRCVLAPPAPDWAAMLRENLPGVTLNPAALVAPAAALAALTLLVAALGHAAATRGRSR